MQYTSKVLNPTSLTLTDANPTKLSPNGRVPQHDYNLRSWQARIKGEHSEVHDQKPNQTSTSKLKRKRKRRCEVQLTWRKEMFDLISVELRNSVSI